MLFENTTDKAKKVRLDEEIIRRIQKYKWVTVKPGETVDIPEHYGHNIGFKPVTDDKEDKPIPEKPEEEPNPNPNEGKFREEILSLEGIGPKTADDILKLYPTETALKEALEQSVELPFRDDAVEALRKKYG